MFVFSLSLFVTLREKCQNTEFFVIRIFLYFSHVVLVSLLLGTYLGLFQIYKMQLFCEKSREPFSKISPSEVVDRPPKTSVILSLNRCLLIQAKALF